MPQKSFKGLVKFPESKRDYVRRVLGRLYTPDRIPELIRFLKEARDRRAAIISVGDRVTYTLLQNNVVPDVAVIDGREKRGAAPEIPRTPFNLVLEIANPPGYINFDLADMLVENWGRRPLLIFVRGEEDLLGFPVVFAAPIGSYLVYGLPGKGVVLLEVSERERRRAENILEEVA